MSFLKRIRGRGPSGPSADPGIEASTGILAGLFTASDEDVSAWSLKLPTPNAWPAFEFKRLETVKLGTLESILTDRPYDSIDQDQLHNAVRMGGPDGPWVSRVRPELVVALAGLSADRTGAVAEAWANTDEFKARPSDPPDPQLVAGLAVLLPAMADFARMSKEAGTPVFLLMSL